MSDEFIKVCGVCHKRFTVESAMSDPELVPIGMMFYEEDIAKVYFFFQHQTAGCGTSLAIPVEAFRAYIDEPIPAARLTLTEHCEHHCARIQDLAACGQPCRFAPYRRFVIKLMQLKCGTRALSPLSPPVTTG